MKRRSEIFLPTSAEIRQACTEIQSAWDERERQKRSRTEITQHWLPPIIDTETLAYNISIVSSE